jgi:hypothetical protein
LRPEEEERIKSQIEEAQATIDKELKDFEDRMEPDENTANGKKQSQSTDKEQQEGGETAETSKIPDTVGSMTNDAATVPPKGDSANSHSVPPSETVHTQSDTPKAHPDEHSGEVMEEGQEDTVIY